VDIETDPLPELAIREAPHALGAGGAKIATMECLEPLAQAFVIPANITPLE
jgi:hypothetical protein